MQTDYLLQSSCERERSERRKRKPSCLDVLRHYCMVSGQVAVRIRYSGYVHAPGDNGKNRSTDMQRTSCLQVQRCRRLQLPVAMISFARPSPCVMCGSTTFPTFPHARMIVSSLGEIHSHQIIALALRYASIAMPLVAVLFSAASLFLRVSLRARTSRWPVAEVSRGKTATP